MLLNGRIAAESKSGGDWYNGSGGSVQVHCGTLLGAGEISADAGYVTSGCAGGGGRVAVYQTVQKDLSLFEGTIHATGGRTKKTPDINAPNSSAGTVYVQNAGERGGEVTLWNNGSTQFAESMGTVIPAPYEGDSRRSLRNVRFRLLSGGHFSLTNDLTVWDVALDSANSKLQLNGHTLTIRSFEHKDRAGWIGTVAEGGGQVIWKKDPRFYLILR